MSSTHRWLNRTLLAVLGLILVAVGALTAAAGLVPDVAEAWTSTGATAVNGLPALLASAPLTADTSWWTIAALALVVVCVALLIGWIASQGGGRTSTVGRQGSAMGNTTVETSLVADALRTALEENGQILAVAVSSWRVRRQTGLRVRVQPRRGASPGAVVAAANEAIAGLDTLLGERIPVLVSVQTGARTRFTRTRRVD
ncbi:hypothetical protein [Arthrobacter sp. Bz4]|uniref:hypothetical protein n=1 Tax=Arthrobacter sp. Bz4 TaxID=2171979 RepID=UPI001FAF730C|nr:hypothetical protein [Arthrobacter sp. Bz4]